jgi:ubiquinone/menaquinone biosynthesis C-methylase UbiE
VEKQKYQQLIEPLSKEVFDRLMCLDCRADLEYTQTLFRCLGCGRTFPIINGVVQMVPGSWLRDHHDLLNQTDTAASQAIDKTKSTQYETLRFQTRRSIKRNVCEQSIVNQFLEQHPEGIWVLDVPCGMGRFNDVLARYRMKVLSIDKRLWRAASTLSKTCGHSTLAIHGDALSLPFRNDSADVALCVRLTHHLNRENLSTLLRELARVAPEVFITFYNAHTFRAQYRKLKKFLRGKQPAYSYSLSCMREMAAKAGLSITDNVSPFGFLHRPIQFLRLKRAQL